MKLLLLCIACHCMSLVSSLAFTPGKATAAGPMPAHLIDPAQRDDHYGQPRNVAQYLVDLHDCNGVFDFCGGMKFQLVLTDKLRDYLVKVASGSKNQPVIFDDNTFRMSKIPSYSQNAFADNIQLFHGREIRQVPAAAGNMNMVLQLSLANGDDPEGWTNEEVGGYDGWGHDVGRQWRTGEMLEKEGFTDFRGQFGMDSYALHHRFYLHFDKSNQMWLSAEDGCEGTPDRPVMSRLSNLFGLGN
mmetsp:Transcript_21455/g.25890  ORF Transcript_21455/g.25890 Transcript_21455/m.25890 type:complete len:244 (+) Transcript_21455:90-821(+)